MTTIRPETPADHSSIRRVNAEAFGRGAEAALVDALRSSPAFIPELSLVAEEASGLVGHILFTRIVLRDGGVTHDALALAPMAVRPAFQNRGFGSALVRQGLDEARRLGHAVVIVQGHPRYYPRFGFVPAGALGIRSPFDARPEAFLALGLKPGALDDVRGLVEYPPEFGAV
jgi:putative acetyltransferase